MFKLRLVSAALLLPLVVGGILYLPNSYIQIASGLVFVIAAVEWLKMTLLKNTLTRILLVALLVIAAANVLYYSTDCFIIYWLAVLWWVLGLIGICYYPRGAAIWQQIFLQPLVGLLMFVPSWAAFNELHAMPNGPVWVLLGCCIIWAADIGAYCCGKLWGKTKLIPEVSPGKTWAGLYGGLASSCLVMLLFYCWFKPAFNIYYGFWLALITSIFAVIGDLVESMLKRIYGVKDSGNIIPGHGGMYDRIDSMLAAFPIYLLGLQILLNPRIMVS